MAQGPKADHFERDGAIETFLMRAINYALTAPADFLQQFVIAKVCPAFLLIACCLCRSGLPHAIVRPGSIDPGYSFLVEQTKTGLKKASRANFLPRVSRNFRSAFSANGGGSLHSDGLAISSLNSIHARNSPVGYARNTAIKWRKLIVDIARQP